MSGLPDHQATPPDVTSTPSVSIDIGQTLADAVNPLNALMNMFDPKKRSEKTRAFLESVVNLSALVLGVSLVIIALVLLANVPLTPDAGILKNALVGEKK